MKLPYLHSPEAAPDWTQWPVPSPEVTKIVIGKLDKALTLESLPEDFPDRFPNLKLLHLWGLKDLRRLPALPVGLVELDVRKCGEVEELPELPAGLEVLVIGDAAKLTRLKLAASYPKLWDVSLAGCGFLEEGIIRSLLKAAPSMTGADFSGCLKLTKLLSLPASLERLELNGCEALVTLPGQWPLPLRRLGLRGAVSLTMLPSFKRHGQAETHWPDYVDLRETRALHRIERPSRLRTLFLYGSGLTEPPASEHGKDENENVASAVLDYFDDVERFGAGMVKRCKLLVLGNGGAGKTSLCLALRHDRRTKLESTHGVQFWPWEVETSVHDQGTNVAVQIWDFGGQEIYHQTHRLFMNKGAVFVVVWHPQQVGKVAPPANSADEYQDEWRSLLYWMEYIHMACPWGARIALVCSHTSSKTPELEQLWQTEVTEKYADQCQCFYINSTERSRELADLEKWLEGAIGRVVETQGTQVPSYWEIAQDMVGEWLPQPDPEEPEKMRPALYNEMSQADFARELEARIEKSIQTGSFPKLSEAVSDGTFSLVQASRLERALGFLTNSGWVYWDPGLFEGRVIIGQQWALDGIYTVLDRRENCRVFRELNESDGQFTRPDLDRWVWGTAQGGRGYSVEEQKLLLSFMQQCGVCFELISEERSRQGEPRYQTFQHLPSAKQTALHRKIEQYLPSTKTVPSPLLHKGHWQAFLKNLGEHYGTDATYASDGFYLINKEGQHICIIAHFRDFPGHRPIGMGGDIEISVAGEDAQKRLKALVAEVERYVPVENAKSAESGEVGESGAVAGTKTNRIRVFISYTWQPRPEHKDKLNGFFDVPVPPDYEEPVDLIEAALKPDERLVEVLRDKSKLAEGDNVMKYISLISEADKVIVVHSDKYWRSPYCMYELWQVFASFSQRPNQMNDTLLFIEHKSSGITDGATRDGYMGHWEGVKSIPTRMMDGMLTDNAAAVAALKTHVKSMLGVNVSAACNSGLRKRWDPAKADEIIDWVKEHLGLKPPVPKFPG